MKMLLNFDVGETVIVVDLGGGEKLLLLLNLSLSG